MGRPIKGHLYKRGDVWWLEYNANGRRVRESLETGSRKKAKAKAEDMLRPLTARTELGRRMEAVAALRTAEDVAKDAEAARNKLLLADAWNQYPYDISVRGKGRKVHPLSPYNVDKNRLCWKKFTRWMQEHHPKAEHLEDVTPAISAEFSKHLIEAKKLSGHRHNIIVQVVSIVFRRAGRTDPFQNVPRYAHESRSREMLSTPELMKVCRAATGELRTLLAIGLFTGLRLGDASTLQWTDIDMTTHAIKKKAAKTSKLSVIPLHPDLRRILEETPLPSRTGFLLPDMAKKYLRDPPAISKLIRLHFKACDVVTQEKRPGAKRATTLRGFHSLRHGLASAAMNAGANAEAIAALLGHNVQLTREIYTHWGMETGRRVVESLPSGIITFPKTVIDVESPPAPESPTDAATAASNDATTTLKAIETTVSSMTESNWMDVRDKVLQLLRVKE